MYTVHTHDGWWWGDDLWIQSSEYDIMTFIRIQKFIEYRIDGSPTSDKWYLKLEMKLSFILKDDKSAIGNDKKTCRPKIRSTLNCSLSFASSARICFKQIFSSIWSTFWVFFYYFIHFVSFITFGTVKNHKQHMKNVFCACFRFWICRHLALPILLLTIFRLHLCVLKPLPSIGFELQQILVFLRTSIYLVFLHFTSFFRVLLFGHIDVWMDYVTWGTFFSCFLSFLIYEYRKIVFRFSFHLSSTQDMKWTQKR